jgi:hypothetical protein
MMDLAAAEVLIGAASNIVDLWLETGWWLPIPGGALLRIVPALATSETSVVAAAVFQHRLLANCLVLVAWLVVTIAAIVPGRLVL